MKRKWEIYNKDKLKGIDFNMKIPKMICYYLRSFKIKNSIDTCILNLFSTDAYQSSDFDTLTDSYNHGQDGDSSQL